MNVDNTEKTIVSFFSGYGGLERGISQALGGNTSVIAYIERDAFPVSNLVAKADQGLMDEAPVYPDAAGFPYRKFYGLVDIACGGVPCQPHSHAGKRKGGADERFLFDIFIEGMSEMRPGIIFIENVEGLLSSKMPDGTLCIRYVLNRLEEIGYCVEKSSGEPLIGIFSAAEVGAPHQRKRVFILAHRGGMVHSTSARRDGEKPGAEGKTRDEARVQVPSAGCCWPSRPGEPQYGWESPRVVGQPANEGRPFRGGREMGRQGEQKSESERPNSEQNNPKCQTQSPLGGDADGPADGLDLSRHTGLSDSELAEIREWMVKGTNRTDELRLCGNGVCPQTAEKAFRTLFKELTDEKP